jgi:NADPH:quinone reductase-like Zn-dependent oxidoreductase
MRLSWNRKMGLLWWKPFKQDDVGVLRALIETGRSRPVIDRTFPLHEVPQALRHLEEKRAVGKIVVTAR